MCSRKPKRMSSRGSDSPRHRFAAATLTRPEIASKRPIGLQHFMPDARLAMMRALADKGLYLAATQASDCLVAMDPKNKGRSEPRATITRYSGHDSAIAAHG